MPNGGLQVINPSLPIYNRIMHQLTLDVSTYEFADQSMLAELFFDRWVTLPYVYNALKTLRWDGVHDVIWRDEEVKNVHMLLSPKAWDEEEGKASDETHKWWHVLNRERLEEEKARGVEDGF
jgi:lipopolysaccharide biosynthesis glycosyltransferase